MTKKELIDLIIGFAKEIDELKYNNGENGIDRYAEGFVDGIERARDCLLIKIRYLDI